MTAMPGPLVLPCNVHVDVAVRIAAASSFLLICIWVNGFLGGLAFSPAPTAGSTELKPQNDTGGVFNWHPLLMALAFLVCMTEAMGAYTVAPYTSLPRDKQKLLHFGLHSTAVVAICFGLVAAFQSHNLKLPQPIPNLYSTHSYLGVTVSSAVFIQYLLAAYSFMWPGITPARRKRLAPWHAFLGCTAFCGGLATMMVGLQEKATFIQAFQKPAVYSAILRIPAIIQVMILFTGIAAVGRLVLHRAAVQNRDDPAESRLLPEL